MFYRSLQQYIVNSSEEYDILARVTQHPDRPRPIRGIDQIFMLPGSQLNQAKLISAYIHNKEVVSSEMATVWHHRSACLRERV